MEIDLPDVNLWVALAAEDHAHHERALQYWNTEAGVRIAFCRITALGFVRVSTSIAALGERALSVENAWRGYQYFRDLPETVFVVEPEDCEAQIEHWALANSFARNMWADAYLAAFARTANLRLVTFDADLKRFADLRLLHLEP